jgi:tetratricopeptide (TPR) repeat protein
LWLPVDRARHARALLVGPSALAVDDDPAAAAAILAEAKALVDRYMLGQADFPSPTPENVEPGSPEFAELRSLADTVDNALLLSGVLDESDPDEVEAGADIAGADLQAFAEVSVLARRPLAAADQGGQGALFGLALAILAHAQNAAGRYELAVASAYEATRVLGHVTSSELAATQPSLVLALDAAAFADLALGRRHEALTRVQRLVFVLRQLAARDPRFGADLEFQLVMLASIHGELGQHEEAGAAVQELADRRAADEPPPAGADPASTPAEGAGGAGAAGVAPGEAGPGEGAGGAGAAGGSGAAGPTGASGPAGAAGASGRGASGATGTAGGNGSAGSRNGDGRDGGGVAAGEVPLGSDPGESISAAGEASSAATAGPGDGGETGEATDRRVFTPAGQADDLYQEGVRLGREGQYAQAETYLASAVAAYRRVPIPVVPDLGRRLALTLWRQSMVLHTLERRLEAMAAGDEAVTLWRGLFEMCDAPDEQLELLAELARACTDLSVIAVSAGLREEPVRLATEAVDRARNLAEQNPSAQPYLSTALHNLAVAHASRDNLDAAQAAIDEAVDLREQLAAGDEATHRELANSQLLCGQLLVQAGRIEDGAQHMADALLLAVELPDADELVARALAAVRSTDELLPGVFDPLDVEPYLSGGPAAADSDTDAPGSSRD